MNRRQFVYGFGGATTIAMAGCLDRGDDTNSPTGVVEQYLNAIEEGDVEAANEVLHHGSDWEPDRGPAEVTVNEIETQPYEEILERIDRYDNDEIDELIAQEEERVEDLADDYNFGMRAYVYVAANSEVFEYDEFYFFTVNTATERRAGAGSLEGGVFSALGLDSVQAQAQEQEDERSDEWLIL